MKKWVLREKISDEISAELSESPELIKNLLYHRGIKTRAEAEFFLSPDYDNGIADPFLILNMDKAVTRVLKAIENNERIIVFGDYDADGVCSSVIFHDFFKKIEFTNFHVHIPDRYLDGYGLNLKAVEEFAKQKASLIITLDCGITSVEGVSKANELGLDVIIVDHHILPETPPKAYAIIDLKQDGETYPENFLSGAGTTFKVICALIKAGNFNLVSGWEKWLLDVVAIATVADMVPLVNENRILVYYGLKVLKKTKRRGLLSLYCQLKLLPVNIVEEDLSFMIAPRINVAGRMEHATISFNLLTSSSREESMVLSEKLTLLNNERKDAVEKMMQTIDAEFSGKNPTVITTGSVDWNPGVLGLVANKVLEKYNCLVFLWGKGGGGDVKGSCRSNGTINLVEFMRQLPEGLFIDIGGHALAAGFSLEEDKVEKLTKEISNLYVIFPKKEVGNAIFIDKELSLDEINFNFFSALDSLQPFGMDNPRPIFGFKKLTIHQVKKFGNGGVHLQLDFKNKDGKTISAIGFFASKNGYLDLKDGQVIDLAASIEKNNFRNKKEIRLRIVDIKFGCCM